MCLFWKARQRRLGIDDFGNPLPDPPTNSQFQHHVGGPAYTAETIGAGTEVLEPEQREAVAEAVRDAVETTPLLPPAKKKGFFSR